MGGKCMVHDLWRYDLSCSCPPERKWAREAMLTDSLEKLLKNAQPKPKATNKVKGED